MSDSRWYENATLVKAVRDTVMFVVGVGGVLYETATPGDARPVLVGVFAAMLGLPFFIRSDEKRRSDDE